MIIQKEGPSPAAPRSFFCGDCSKCLRNYVKIVFDGSHISASGRRKGMVCLMGSRGVGPPTRSLPIFTLTFIFKNLNTHSLRHVVEAKYKSDCRHIWHGFQTPAGACFCCTSKQLFANASLHARFCKIWHTIKLAWPAEMRTPNIS